MKKILSIITTVLLLLVIAVSCAQDVTVDTQLYGAQGSGTFMLNGKYYNTLQEAVNARLGKGAKAAGANDDVIYLTRNAKGPGAKIDDPNISVIIDFAGWTYSFTDVTATQGSTTGTFGLSITGGADVTLKGLEQIDLHDTTANLTMVYVEGATTTLTIEDAPKMKVEPSQYVFWAANGATLTVGSNSTTAPTTISGKIAATGGTTAESKPVVTFNNNTSVKASEFKADAAVVIVNTSSESTVDSLVASNNAVVVVSGSGDVKIESDDSSDTASYEIQNTSSEATITVKEEGESSTTIPAGKAEKVVDGETQPQTDSSYVASNRSGLYTTLDAAMDSVASEDTVLLLANIATSDSYTVQDGVVLTIDFNGRTIISDNVTSTTDVAGFLLNNGTVIFTDNSGSATVGGIVSGNNNVVINNGIMTIEKGSFKGNRNDIKFVDRNNNTRGVINNSQSGVLTINDIVLYTAQDYGLLNKGAVVINGGTFDSDSCAARKIGTADSMYGYCVSSLDGTMTINNGTITGIHGGVGVNGGVGIINNCSVTTRDTTLDGSTTYTSSIHYALYLAGEEDECQTTINDGTFTAAKLTSALIGNNSDGGLGRHASVTINGGTFIGGGSSQAITLSFMGPGYGSGDVSLNGGVFKNANATSNANKVISAYTLDYFVSEGYATVSENNAWTVVPVFASGKGTEEDPFIIANAEQLGLFRDSVNQGRTYKDSFIKLNSDIALTGTWTPIGNGARSKTGSGATEVDSYTGNAFKGTFNGNGKTIKNLSNDGYSPAYKKGNEYTYGLFGVVEGATIKDLTLSNVAIYAPKESTLELEGDSVGAIVGYSLGSLELTKCTVSGSVEAYAAVGGVAGRVYGLPDAEITISDCTNNSTVTGSEHVAGVVGWLDGSPRGGSGSSEITVEKCVNNGNVTDNGTKTGVAGVFCFGQESRAWSLTATGNANHGTLTQTTGGEFGYVATCDNGHDYYRITYLTYKFADNNNDGTIITSATRDKFIISAMGFDNAGQWDYSGDNYMEYDGKSHTPNTSN